jgi:hypothetical protein
MEQSSSKTKCIQTINDMFEKYKDNDYMLNRITTHIDNYLPTSLENELANYEKRLTRQSFLTTEQQIFIQVFLSKHQYYYLATNNHFYEYDGKNYKIVKEDDIIHCLLSNISKDRVLLQWKHKTKINIIKQIKDRNLFSSIPETDTIQNILGLLYPYLFQTKNQAKHFLTILGDNINKKNGQLIFLVSPRTKKFLLELEYIANLSIGHSNITNNFMTKYHENHVFENCRLLKINDNVSFDVWKDILRNYGLDLLCVASHYSIRHGNSDMFLDNNADEETKDYIYFLKDTPQIEIIDTFCSKYIVKDEMNSSKIEWKMLHFLWKQYLTKTSLPVMIYANNLKGLLKEKYSYDETTDSFTNITSKYLPLHSEFIKFWESTINVTNVADTTFDSELEIDEICSLFKLWSKQMSTNTSMTNNSNNINEENVLSILRHFFSDVVIVDDKYVLNVSSVSWNKNKDIENSFDYIKMHVKTSNQTLLSFEDAYNFYYTYCNNISHKLIVSKRYFEKFLYYKISAHIIYENFIETNWFYM